MTGTLKKIHDSVEGRLYRNGFRRAELRQLIMSQIYMSSGLVLMGLVLLPFTSWFAFVSIGAILAALNFYYLARFLQEVVVMRFTSALLMAMLFRFLGRLLVTGLVLYVCIIMVKAPIVALLVGLTASVGSIFVWGCAQLLEHNGKEA